MTPSLRSLLLATLLPALAFAQKPQQDGSFAGAFRWTTLNGKAAPQVAPDGRTTIVASALQFEDSTAAGRRFKLSFTIRSSPTDSAVTVSHAGRFRFTRDSLYFVNDGQEMRPPVRFKYVWLNRERVALTDIQGHVWVYVK